MEAHKYQEALKKDPGNPAALRVLGEQAAADGKWEETAAYLQKEADVSTDVNEKSDLLFRKARLESEKLGKPEDALNDLRAALKINPAMRAARQAEWRILIELGKYEELVRSIEIEAKLAARVNPSHSAALYMVIAHILEFQMNNQAKAEQACQKALSGKGDLRLASIPILEIRCRQARWEEMAQALDEMQNSSTSHEEKAAWALLKANLLENRLSRPDEADGMLKELIESAGQARPPWFGMAELARSELAFARNAESDLKDILSSMLSLFESEQEPPPAGWRSAMWFRVGELQESVEEEGSAALETYIAAHERTPEDLRPLRAMIRLQRGGSEDDILASRQAFANVGQGPATSWIFRLFVGRTLDYGLNRLEEALEWYKSARQSSPTLHLMEIEGEALRRLGRWQEVNDLRSEQLEIVKDDKLKAALLQEKASILQHRLGQSDKATEALKQALAVPATALGMVRNLAQCYADMGTMENLIGVMTGQERIIQYPEYIVHLNLCAADMWQRLGRDDEALKSLSAAVQKSPGDMEALLMLEEICSAKKSNQNLYGIQQRIIQALDKNSDARLAEAISLDHASLLVKAFQNEDAALPVLRSVLEYASDSAAALLSLRMLAYRGARWEEYFDLLKREIDVSGRHPYLLWRAALMAWSHIDDVAQAIQFLSEIAGKHTHTVMLLETLKTLQMLADDWMAWLGSAAELAQLLDDAGRTTLFYEMARVHQFRLKSPDTAAECYDRIVELEPQNTVAHESLCMLYLEKNDVGGLRNFHSTMLDLERDPAVCAAHLFARAELALNSGDMDAARSDLTATLEYSPDNLAVLRRLERLYAESNHIDAQIEILKSEISLRQDPRYLILLFSRQARLWEKKKSPAEAIACYEEVLKHDPKEPDALDALTKLYKQGKMWNELQANLERHASVVSEPAKKIVLLVERAKVLEENLKNPEAAIESHVAALEVDGNHLPSLKELERLYMAVESWENELAILKRELDLAADTEEQHRIHFKMGSIYEEKMSAPSAAITSFVKALGLHPEHLRTLDALERLYTQARDAAKLIPILEKKSALLPSERVKYYMWIGKLWAESLNDPAKAVASYERVLLVDPQNVDAISILISLFEKTEQWENLIRTLNMKAETVQDKAEAVQVLSRVGELWIERFQNDQSALDAYTRALEINPKHRPALEKSREINYRLENWEEVVKLFTREVEFTTEPKAKAGLFTSMADVIKDKIGNAQRAAQNYEMALRADANHMSAVRPLAKIYYSHSKWDQANHLYRKWIESLSGQEPAEEQALLFYEHGRIYQALSQDKEAITMYRHSIGRSPEFLEPMQAIAELHEQRKEWNEAIEAQANLLALYEKQGEKEAAGQSLFKMGTFSENVGNVEDAIKHYTRSAQVAGDNGPVLENLIRLFSSKQLFNNVIGLFDRLLVIKQGDPEEASIYLRKGEVLEDQVGDKDRALAEYNKALELNPNNVEALKRQTGLLIKIFKWEEASSSAQRMLQLVKEPDQLADAHCLTGKIEQEGKKDLPAAKAAYEKALEIQPTHLGAMDHIGEILEAMDDWKGYVQAFEKFLKRIPTTMVDRIRDIHLRLGAAYRDNLKSRDKAILEFNSAVKADADCEEAHAALAKLYLQEKSTYPMAIRENGLILKNNAYMSDAYSDMAKIYEEQKEIDRAFCMLAVLDFMGTLGKWEKTNFDARLEHLPSSSNKSVDDETRDRALVHPTARHPAMVLLKEMGSSVCKALMAGSPPGNPAPSSHPARKKAAELATNLGVSSFELILEDGHKAGVSWFPGNPPAIVIDPGLYDLSSDRGKRFMLGRGLEGIQNGLASIWGLSDSEVRKRLQLIVKVFKSDIAVAGMNEKDAGSLVKSLKKDVPRKVRKHVEDAATNHHAQERQLSIESFRSGLLHSANRGGLLVCGHPGEAATALLMLERKIKKGEKPSLNAMQASEQLEELMRFIVSDVYFLTRKKTGFSLY